MPSAEAPPHRPTSTRIGLLGDIHGDLRALESALSHLDDQGVDRLLCTGDLVGYGWQADEVVARVRERGIPCVRGNHDRWALERRQVIGTRGWKPARFGRDTWDFLAELPVSWSSTIDGVAIEVHHGSPGSDTEFVTPYRPLPPSIAGHPLRTGVGALVLGHTHIPMVDRSDRGVLINPGSVLGVPGVQTSYSFAVLDLASFGVVFHEVRSGREFRRDPLYLDGDP